MRDVHVVTCFLLRRAEDGDSILVLRRSERASTYRGRWAAVSGYLESETPLEQAYREIEEEVGLARGDVRLLAEGEPLTVVDDSIDTRWTVHPFLFEALRPERLRLERAYREIEEEAGLARDDVRPLSEGEPLTVTDTEIDTRWTVHPFLFEALRPERLRLDWEHTESRWVKPEELPDLETVPGLAEALARVYPP